MTATGGQARSVVPGTPPIAQELAGRVLALRSGARRVIVGIAGAPGTGKSTLARRIAEELRGAASVDLVRMDGFHLSNRVLRRLGREGRKGAIGAAVIRPAGLRGGALASAPGQDAPTRLLGADAGERGPAGQARARPPR